MRGKTTKNKEISKKERKTPKIKVKKYITNKIPISTNNSKSHKDKLK